MNIKLSPKEPWSGILIAELSELGFDSFVETEDGIQAYGSADLPWNDLFSRTSLYNQDSIKYQIEKTIIPHRNWNEEWESNFKPVYVEELLTILAPFHADKEVKGIKVIIQPQMSFGTGHHQTTWLMSKYLFEMEMPEKVLDMGTGTGVLAIIAEKRGAEDILAIDIEEWSAENARLNVKLNECNRITVLHGDADKIEGKQFGLIIANINKNILKSQMPLYSKTLESGGSLLLSGFFTSDVPEMEAFCLSHKLVLQDVLIKDEWAAMRLIKTN